MNSWKAINMRLLVVGLMLLFALGCASTRGTVGVGWGDPAPQPEIRVSHKNGPPAHAPAHGYRAKHCYRYYPERDVYYDTERRIYFYIEGDLWKSDASLPYHIGVSLGKYQTVELDSDTPYEYHKKHKHKKKHVPPGKAKKGKRWVKY